MSVMPLFGAIGGVLMVFVAQPTHRIIAWLAALLVGVPALFQAQDALTRADADAELKRMVYQDLLGQTNAFLDNVSYMIFDSSDGSLSLPITEEDFFSERVAKQLCRRLNIDANGSIFQAPWWRTVMNQTAPYRAALSNTLDTRAQVLDASTLKLTRKLWGSLSGSPWISAPAAVSQRQDGHAAPPLLCWGTEPLMAGTLEELRTLLLDLEEHEPTGKRRDWLRFPSNMKPGTAFFSREALVQFRKDNPGSNGPTKYGPGDPNKTGMMTPESQRAYESALKDD